MAFFSAILFKTSLTFVSSMCCDIKSTIRCWFSTLVAWQTFIVTTFTFACRNFTQIYTSFSIQCTRWNYSYIWYWILILNQCYLNQYPFQISLLFQLPLVYAICIPCVSESTPLDLYSVKSGRGNSSPEAISSSRLFIEQALSFISLMIHNQSRKKSVLFLLNQHKFNIFFSIFIIILFTEGDKIFWRKMIHFFLKYHFVTPYMKCLLWYHCTTLCAIYLIHLMLKHIT